MATSVQPSQGAMMRTAISTSGDASMPPGRGTEPDVKTLPVPLAFGNLWLLMPGSEN